MPSHTFTGTPPDDMLTIQLGAPPPGATSLVIRAQFIPPPVSDSATVRLLHLRRAGKGLKPAAAEVVEVLCNQGTGIYTAGFSGFGQKHAKAQPQHLGKVRESPVDVVLTVPLVAGQEAVVAVEGLSGHAVPDLLAAGPLELLVGFTGAGDLHPPEAWTVLWDEHAVQWVPASPTNPAFPPSPGGHGPIPPPVAPPPVLPQPEPPAPPTGGATEPTVPSGVPPTDPRAIALAALLPALFPHLTREQLSAASALLPLLFGGR